MRKPLFLLLALVPAVPLLQRALDLKLGAFRVQEEVLYLWSGRQVRTMSFGFENLLADLYWLRTVQYFGGQRRFASDKRFDLLEPLIDITATLDPRLEIAYRYGATFLSEPPPVGAGRPKNGVALLERGAAALPASWRLRQDLGFFIHLFLKDHARAAGVLRGASSVPGAPFWLDMLAASILAKGGDRVSARHMWQQMYEQAEGGFLKDNARQNLRVLDTLDQVDRLTAAASSFEKAQGRRPRSLAELARTGLATVPIVDMEGHPFAYDPDTGTLSVSTRSTLWRPPQ